MADQEKAYVRHFKAFTGLSNAEAPIADEVTSAINALNIYRNRRGTLTTRKGYKIAAPTDDFSPSSSNYYFHSNGIHTYSYADKTTGAVNELLITGGFASLFVYTAGSFTIANTDASTWNYSFLLDESSSTYRFIVTKNGTPITISGNPYYDTGTGLEDTPSITVQDLCDAVDAHANFTCTTPTKGAVVNGNQAGVTTFNVFAGHGVTAGDVIYFVNQAATSYVTRWVTATTGTSITVFGAVVSVNNNQRINTSLAWAIDVEATDNIPTQVGGSITVPFYYWRPIASTTAVFAGTNDLANVSYVNLQNVCYCCHPRISNGNIYKFDGTRIYKAGLPTTPTISSAVVGAAGNVDAGSHNYIVVLWNVDNQNNITESNATALVNATPGVASQVTVTWTNPQNFGGDWNNLGATVNGNQVGVTAITVTAGHTFLPGDTAYLLDRSTGSYVTRPVTAATTTVVTISGAVVNVNNGDYISNNWGAKIYRSKVGGIEYFLVAQVPGTPASTQAYIDNISDANLTSQYIYPTYVHDFPPRSTYLCEHQGKLVASGTQITVSATDTANPNTIAWSSDDSCEYFPPDNALDLPPTQRGAITGIRTDSDNILFAGKERGLYGIFGDLTSGALNVNTIAEGDYGCLSHFSIIRAGDTLYLPSYLSFIAIRGGSLDPSFGNPVMGYFNNNFFTSSTFSATETTKFYLPAIVGVNYPEIGCMIWSLPTPQSTNATNYWGGVNSLTLAYNYQRNEWYNWGFGYDDSTGLLTDKVNANFIGGATIYQNELYCMTRRKRTIGGVSTPNGALFRFHGYRFSNLKYNFADNHLKIPTDLQPSWEFLDYPSVDREIKALKVYMQDPTNFVPFVLRVRTYRNFSTTTADSDTTLTFSAATDLEKIATLKLNKCRAVLFRMSISAIHSSLSISGYEFTVFGSGLKDGFSRQ